MALNNVMIDTETLSADDGAVIVTIAAVKFDFTSDDQETFSVSLDPIDGKNHGFSITQDTVDWWKTLPPEASRAWIGSKIGVIEGINMFNDWLGPAKALNVWCHGIDFDLPKIRSYYAKAGLSIPWKYWNQNDTRTIFNAADYDYRKAPRIGVYHNAVDDCRTQIASLKSVLFKKAI